MHGLPIARAGQLLASCVAVGLGVGLVLTSRFGSDGYSSLVNGLALSTGVSYAFVNPAVGLSMVLFAWFRGVRPGVGTIAHPVIVGLTVNIVLDVATTPQSLLARLALLGLGGLVLGLGVAGYLDTQLGSGPFEAVTLALQPLPFGLAYNGLQATGALLGWLLGADLGIGTLLVVIGIGPLVQTLRRPLARRRASFGSAEGTDSAMCARRQRRSRCGPSSAAIKEHPPGESHGEAAGRA